jgi:predicted transcriptional regulator of viral defense system
MNVKTGVGQLDQIREILQERNGILLTADLTKAGIPRTYLSILESRGEIERIARGVYLAANAMVDDMVALQARYKGAIFSHETSLYLLDLTDRSPLSYSVTVPTGYNATLLKESGAKVYFVKRDLRHLGETMAKSPIGNEVKSYNLERTICDVLRSRNQMDVQFVNEALKRYARKKERSIDRLYAYAQQFHIQKIVRATIEVLL